MFGTTTLSPLLSRSELFLILLILRKLKEIIIFIATLIITDFFGCRVPVSAFLVFVCKRKIRRCSWKPTDLLEDDGFIIEGVPVLQDLGCDLGSQLEQ